MWYKYLTYILTMPNPASRASWKILSAPQRHLFFVNLFCLTSLSSIWWNVLPSVLLLFTIPYLGLYFSFGTQSPWAFLMFSFNAVWLFLILCTLWSVLTMYLVAIITLLLCYCLIFLFFCSCCGYVCLNMREHHSLYICLHSLLCLICIFCSMIFFSLSVKFFH